MANEKRLIDANALWKVLDEARLFESGNPRHIAQQTVEEQPTVDAVEVKHGRWEKAHIAGYLKCSCCKDAFIYKEWLESGKWNYCPNCGAKMDGGKENV